MDGLLDRTFGERPHASRLVNVPKLDIPGISGRTKAKAVLRTNYDNRGAADKCEIRGQTAVLSGNSGNGRRLGAGHECHHTTNRLPSKARSKSVPVRFAISPEVAKSLAEQLVVAARTAESHRQRGY